MKAMQRFAAPWALLTALITPLVTGMLPGQALALELAHVEPPNWWVGMREPRLQLMLHGPDLARLQARVQAPGIRLRGQQAGDSPNILFLELEIDPAAPAGTLDIELLQQGRSVHHLPYELKAREPGSAQRRGFDSRDAIYLVVPDRFASARTASEPAKALGDPPRREDKEARHGGDLAGLEAHLDYIAGMGFTQLWSTPVLENRQPSHSYHGYSITDLYQVDARLGSNADYLRLAAKARRLGLGLIQDIVPNHIGSGHWWMTDLPMKNWIHGAEPYQETNHRHNTVQDPYASKSDRRAFVQGWFVPTMPDLNTAEPLLARYLTQNAIWWIEAAGLSGLRVDTYPYSDKRFLRQWTEAILHEYPNFSLVGEEMSDNPLMVSYWLRGAHNADGYRGAMPSMMDFPLHGRLREALQEPDEQGFGQGLGKLYEAMMNDRLYPEPERMVLFEGNHDTNRVFSALGEDLALMKMAAVVIATTRRTPQFFYGTELLMTSPIERDDGAVRADFPGGWAGDVVNGFTGQGLKPAQADFQQFMRRLLNWRKTASAVQRGRLLHFNPQQGCYVYFRIDAQQTVMVILNKGREARQLPLARFAEALPAGPIRARDVISGETRTLGSSLELPPRSVTVLELRGQP